MLKAIVLVVTGIIAFVIAFSWVNKDEIMAEAATRMAEDFVAQCSARAQFPEEVAHRAEEICGCMKYEFDERGISLGDAFGSKREEMQEITQACVMVYR
ncbi:hypothetical protein [Altererythrobacter lutimaris]|uniref:Uncharacterized protein n=1 Tax=Altererythrobacter lutimaris TaxID=2743979 RepID=A0A850HGV6_9SPHN|nr:hypothetical protein [Altererythrobacter lutimaris]NVE94112.1 hypothetical protein [Altererythrobacter lutimaris]